MVGAFATVVVTLTLTVVGGVAPPIFGNGVVTVLGIVVAGSVVNDNAAFFCRTVVTVESSLSLDPPPHAANPKIPVTMTAETALALNILKLLVVSNKRIQRHMTDSKGYGNAPIKETMSAASAGPRSS